MTQEHTALDPDVDRHPPDDVRGVEGDEVAEDPRDARGPGDGGLFPAPVTPAPRTGDAAVDEALADLEQGARDDDLDAQVGAGERAHRALRARLDDLGTA